MGTPYDVFTESFLNKVNEYDFISLPEYDAMYIVDGYMKKACSQFNRLCEYDLSSRDDMIREFSETIPDEAIDEIADIISEGMLVQWMKPYVYKQENLQNVLNTADFTTYSPAELLLRISNAYAKVQKDFTVMMREYSYNHGDLTDLHL